MDNYQKFIHVSRYARWNHDLGRRENYLETVDRLIKFYREKFVSIVGVSKKDIFDPVLEQVRLAILNQDVMPSMRAMMTAGPAAERENIAVFNCSYLAVNHKRSFAECLYILLCSTGVGFSCENWQIENLPSVPATIKNVDYVISVADSKEGWAEAYKKLIYSLYDGDNPSVDYSKVRPAGAVLKTFGGRASGPEPLKKLFQFTVAKFKEATGRKLTALEVHDLICMIGEVVVVGGVRRSALISLSDLSDQDMALAKVGNWYSPDKTPWRALANNSAVYSEKPSAELFLQEWLNLVKSKAGERGIFNRYASQKQAARYGRRSATEDYGCNPCSEIILRDKQFCNLSEVVVRPSDNFNTLIEKVRLATIIGTLQATMTNFNFLSEGWRKNTEEERLLGVSLTGIMDNTMTSGCLGLDLLAENLGKLREVAVETNKEWSEFLRINPSAAITCVKPSGTVSQLVDSASGMHVRHSKFYLRTVRLDKKDPVYKFLLDSGVYIEDSVNKPDDVAVVYFPMKSPVGALTRESQSAIEALEMWMIYQEHWCEHKPSVTISVKDDEWVEVGNWVYKHFDKISGVSFLPYDGGTYQQAPYQEITEAEYLKWLCDHPIPNIDWKKLSDYESEDYTVSAQNVACVAGSCEI